MDIDDYKTYGEDYCWRVLWSHNKGNWNFVSTVYNNDSIVDFENRFAGPPPAGKDTEKIWEATWDKNLKVTENKSNKEFKVFNELIQETNGGESKNGGWNLSLQMYIRDEELYKDLLDGDALDFDLAGWVTAYTQEVDDYEELELDFKSATTKEKTQVGTGKTKWNLSANSALERDVWCNPSSSASTNKCRGAECKVDSECHSNKCDFFDKYCAAKPKPVTPVTDAEAAAAGVVIIIIILVCICCCIGGCIYCCVAGVACFAKSVGAATV